MRTLAFAVAVVFAALSLSPSIAFGAGAKSRPVLNVSFDHGASKAGKGVKVRVHNDSSVDLEKITLSISVVKTNGVAVESSVDITDLAADGTVPTSITLPMDDAGIASVRVVRAVARTSSAERVVPDVQVVNAH